MTETINTLIIGGGQAGLALSYLLLQKGHPHLIIEQAAQPAEAWRKQRWDTFTFVTPNWSIQMPGGEYDGPDPDGFLPRDEIVAYFENYVRRHNLPIRYNVRATGLGKTDDTFRVETTTDTFEAKNVVIATGLFQKPKLPAFSKNIAPSIRQLHSGEYRNSAALAPGAVLVIGSGQSGCQIAEELYQIRGCLFQSLIRTVIRSKRAALPPCGGFIFSDCIFSTTANPPPCWASARTRPIWLNRWKNPDGKTLHPPGIS